MTIVEQRRRLDGSAWDGSPSGRPSPLRRAAPAAALRADLHIGLRRWGWLLFLAAGVATLAVYPRLGETARAITYVSVGAASLGAVVVPAVRRSGRCVLGWRWVAAGLGAFVVADLVWVWFDLVVGQPPPFPSIADFIYLGGYPLLIAGYLALFGFDRSRDARNRWVDALIVGIATIVAMGQLVLLPTLASVRDVSLATAAVSALYPIADVLLVVAAVLTLPLARRHDLSGWLLGAGASTMLLADVAYASELVGGVYAEASILDVGWLTTYVGIGAAALRPPGTGLRRAAGTDGFQRPLVLVWTVSVLVAVAASAYQILNGTSDVLAVAVGATGVTTLFILISLRVRRMVRRVVAAESRSRAILDALVDTVLTVDAGGVVRAVDGNRALVGDDRLVGTHIGDLLTTVPPPSPQDVAVMHVDAVEVSPPHAPPFTADVTLSRPDDDHARWFVVVRNATDRHRAEEAVRRASQRTAAANSALREANTRLELANVELSRTVQLKQDFLSLVSHELRTPLTPILGFTDLLLRRWDQLTDDLRRTHLEAIQRHGQRLRQAVDNLLVIAVDRGGSTREDARVTDVGVLVMAAVTEAEVPVEVDVAPGPAAVRFDPAELRLLLRTLMDNAVAHGAGPYRVEIGGDADWVDVRVCDSGPGMPPRLLGEMFEPFTQGSVGDQRTVSGLGIGLAVARTLAELNEGSIRYETREQSGACFLVRLRRAYPEPSGAATSTRPEAQHFEPATSQSKDAKACPDLSDHHDPLLPINHRP